MKKSPSSQKLEEFLRSSRLVAGGFMGEDKRSLNEIIDADSSKVSKLGTTVDELAEAMQRITDIAIAGLGTWVKVDDKRQAMVEEAKGSIVCPWPHPAQFAKRVTIVRLIESGLSVRWSDLNIHLIAEHGFFEGRGSAFRTEPEELVSVVF